MLKAAPQGAAFGLWLGGITRQSRGILYLPRKFFALLIIVQPELRGDCGFKDVCRVKEPLCDYKFTRQTRQNRGLPRKSYVIEIVMDQNYALYAVLKNIA